MLNWLRKTIRPVCPCCNGEGGFMFGYYQPEFSGCRCCNPNEDNDAKITHVWRWRWWSFRFDEWRGMRRLDKWIDQQPETQRVAKGPTQQPPGHPMTIQPGICECPRCGRMHKHLGTPPAALSRDDFARLSRAFGEVTGYRTSQDIRINEWLKVQLSSFTAAAQVGKEVMPPGHVSPEHDKAPPGLAPAPPSRADEAQMALCQLDWIAACPAVSSHRVNIIRKALERLAASPSQPIHLVESDANLKAFTEDIPYSEPNNGWSSPPAQSVDGQFDFEVFERATELMAIWLARFRSEDCEVATENERLTAGHLAGGLAANNLLVNPDAADRIATLTAELAESRDELFDLRNRAGCGPDQTGPDVWQQLAEARKVALAYLLEQTDDNAKALAEVLGWRRS